MSGTQKPDVLLRTLIFQTLPFPGSFSPALSGQKCSSQKSTRNKTRISEKLVEERILESLPLVQSVSFYICLTDLAPPTRGLNIFFKTQKTNVRLMHQNTVTHTHPMCDGTGSSVLSILNDPSGAFCPIGSSPRPLTPFLQHSGTLL